MSYLKLKRNDLKNHRALSNLNPSLKFSSEFRQKNHEFRNNPFRHLFVASHQCKLFPPLCACSDVGPTYCYWIGNCRVALPQNRFLIHGSWPTEYHDPRLPRNCIVAAPKHICSTLLNLG